MVFRKKNEQVDPICLQLSNVEEGWMVGTLSGKAGEWRLKRSRGCDLFMAASSLKSRWTKKAVHTARIE